MSELHIAGNGEDADSGAGVHLLDLAAVVAGAKWLVLGTSALVGTGAVLYSLLTPPVYLSTTRILPPQQQSSGVSQLLGQLGGLAGAAGSVAGIKNPNDMYVGLLESRTVADKLIGTFKLRERYQANTMDEARDKLSLNREIGIGKKDGMIQITVGDREPQFAADLANAYAAELARLTQTMALTEASQRRMFFEKQLEAVKDQLAEAESTLRSTQEKTGMIQPQAQVQAIISSLAQVKGTIAAKEVQLNAMRTFSAAGNPEYIRAQEELRSLRAQLSKLEQRNPGAGGDFMVPTGDIPAVGVQYVRGARNVKYYETMFELLAKQFELAKIDEAKDAALIQVLDKAIPAETRSKPKRTLISLGGFVAGGLLGILLAFARMAYRKSRNSPVDQPHWRQLGMAWRGRANRSDR